MTAALAPSHEAERFGRALEAAYAAELPKFRRQADIVLSYYGYPVEPEDLVQTAMLSLWRRRGAPVERHHAAAIVYCEMREQALKASVSRRRYQRVLQAHAHQHVVGMAWGHEKDSARERLGHKVARVNGCGNVGARLRPWLDEIAVSPACAAFLRAAARLMPLQDLALLALHYLADYSAAALARSNRTSRSRIEYRLKRARDVLRRHPHLATILSGE